MLQGAFDYTMNLAGELWMIIWKPTEEPQVQVAREMSAQITQQVQGVMPVHTSAGMQEAGSHEPLRAADRSERGG
jgi:hypothetical protein